MIQDVEAERAVLGAVIALASEGASKSVVDSTGPLPPEAFTESRRFVWEAILALAAEGQAVDALTLAERLGARRQLAAVGGASELLDFDKALPLEPITGARITSGLPSYVAIVRDRMERRKLEEAAELLRQKAHDLLCPPAGTAASMVERLAGVRGQRVLRYADGLVYEMLDRWEANIAAARDGRKGVSPILPFPHEPFEGRGPLRGKVGVVAGRSGGFKTGLVSDSIWHWGHTLGEKGGVMGLEDGCSWFLERLTARRISIAYAQVGFATLDEGQQVALHNWCAEAHATLRANVFCEDDRTLGSGARVTFMRDVFPTLQLWADHGARWAVVDHGLCIDWRTDSGEERNDMAIGAGLRMCSRLAERSGMAILFLWHLNRQSEEETLPTRGDLAESAYLDREARHIEVLWKQKHRAGYRLSTTVKATKGEEGLTVALPMTDAPYGLLGRTGGYVVDFEEEAREAKERAEAARASRKLFGGAR